METRVVLFTDAGNMYTVHSGQYEIHDTCIEFKDFLHDTSYSSYAPKLINIAIPLSAVVMMQVPSGITLTLDSNVTARSDIIADFLTRAFK